MQMRMDEQSLAKITAAVTDAEKRTSGEIVVVIAERSGRYQEARAVFALVASSVATLAAVVIDPDIHASWLLLNGFVALAAYAIASVPMFARFLVDGDHRAKAVASAAKLAFVDRGVHRTRDRSGVLVYLSLLERRVQIIGDENVHKVVGDDGWKKYVARIVEDPAATAAVVADIGALLAGSFPRRADDKNELPDAVVVQRG